MSNPYTLIDTPEALRELARRLQDEPLFALDTEFVWERTYYARLGLVQIGCADESVYLLDTVAVPDLSPLGDLLLNENIMKILHDAPQDLMIMRRATGASCVNVFDTRLASGFIGLTSSLSLQNLLIELLNVRLDKHSTRTDWTRRPLTEDQLSYAVEDVLYLPKVTALIQKKAEKLGFADWLKEELTIYNRSPRFEDPVPEEQFFRLKEAPFAPPEKRAVLYELATWRERRAQELDIPRRRVLDDPELSSVAIMQPHCAEELKECDKLSPNTARRYGKQLLDCVQRGLNTPEANIPAAPFSAKSRSIDRDDVKDTLGRIQSIAEERGLDPLLVATSKDAALYVHQRNNGTLDSNPLRKGWRRELLGKILPT